MKLHLQQSADGFRLVYDSLGKESLEGAGADFGPPSGGYGYMSGGIFWANSPVAYYLNENGSTFFPAPDEGEDEAIREGFQTWQDVVGSSIQFAYMGKTANWAGNFFDYMNVVGWTPMGGDVLAITWTWKEPYAPYIIQADVQFNDDPPYDYPWKLTGEPYTWDVQGVATHEAGHWLQLLDLGDEVDGWQTMYFRGGQGTWQRDLYWGDIAGVRNLYQETVEVGSGLGWESQGGDLALGDINGNGTQDMVLARVNNGEGNYIFYWVGYDISGATGQVTSWSDLRWYPNWIGEDSAGLGAALTNIDSDPRLDLVLVWVNVIPSGPDNGYYSVGMNLNADGWPTHWTPVTWGFQVSWEIQGAGVALADLNGDANHRPDMVVNWADNSSSNNYIRYRIFWDMDASGQVTGMSNEFSMPDPIGTETQGVGITILNYDSDTDPGHGNPSVTLDYVMFWVDNPPGDNHQRYRVGWDVNAGAAGVPGSWSAEYVVGHPTLGWDGSETAGAGIASANIDGDGRPDLTVMFVDNPPEDDFLLYRIV